MTTRKSKRSIDLQIRLAERILKNPPSFLQECEFRPVRSKEEFVGCSKLVHQQYVNREYMIPHRNELRLSIHQTTEKATTFIALYKRKYILATLTLVEDSALGIPMDKIYKEELQKLRKDEKKIGEVTMLAQNTPLMNHPKSGFKKSYQMVVLLYLFRELLAWRGAKAAKLDTLVACFHPRHAGFYQALLFTPLAGIKEYQSVQGSPALAYWMDLGRFETSEDPAAAQFRSMVALVDANRPEEVNQDKIRFKFGEFYEIFINLD